MVERLGEVMTNGFPPGSKWVCGREGVKEGWSCWNWAANEPIGAFVPPGTAAGGAVVGAPVPLVEPLWVDEESPGGPPRVFFSLALRFWNQIWTLRPVISTFSERWSRIWAFGEGFLAKASSKIMSCSGVVRFRFFDKASRSER